MFSAWGHIWSNSRARLLVGRVGMLVYIFFNSRVLARGQKQLAATAWEECKAYLETLPPIDVVAGAPMADAAAEGTSAAMTMAASASNSFDEL